MSPHLQHRFEYRVVDDAQNMIIFRGVANPLSVEQAVFVAPNAVPNAGGPFRLDFYADVNASGDYDGIGDIATNDHAWRYEPLVDSVAASDVGDGVVSYKFLHSAVFTDIDQFPAGTDNAAVDTGLEATVHVSGLTPYKDALVEVRVTDAANNAAVGQYRTMQGDADTLDAVIEGICDPNHDYVVSLYIDANANGTYDDPSANKGDLGFQATVTSNDDGLLSAIDVAAGGGTVAVGPP